MQRAKSLLADPDMSVTQVGFNLGSSDTSSFDHVPQAHRTGDTNGLSPKP